MDMDVLKAQSGYVGVFLDDVYLVTTRASASAALGKVAEAPLAST